MTETTHSTGPRWGAWPMTARTNEKSIATSTTTLTVRHVSTAASLHPPWGVRREVFGLGRPIPHRSPITEIVSAEFPGRNGRDPARRAKSRTGIVDKWRLLGFSGYSLRRRGAVSPVPPKRPMSNDDASPPRGQITMERHGALWIATFRGEHDLSTADLARELLDEARLQADVVVVDLIAVTFVDSTIVGVFFKAYEADTPSKIRFVVAAHTQPRDMLTMTGLNAVLPMYDRLEDALDAGGDDPPS
jgi:anti-sigma B factor antagonist